MSDGTNTVDPLGARAQLTTSQGTDVTYYRLEKLVEDGLLDSIDRLPYTVRILRDDIVWADLLSTFIELGGDGFYGSYQPAHLEPVFASLNAAVDRTPERYPHFAGRLPRYERGLCPVWESIQPRIVMLKTNYFDTDDVDRQADLFAQTLQRFS